MRFVLDAIYVVAGLVYLPVLLYRIVVRGKSRRGWSERFGFVPTRSHGDRCIWIHAVSVGEVNATVTLVKAIEKELPHLAVVVSSTTDTGSERAAQIYPNHVRFRYPLDFSWAVRRAIRRLRPAVIVLMELETWPNLIEVARRYGVPVMIANGRITEQRSMRRFRWPVLRPIARRMFSRLSCVGAQDATYAARFRELGTPADRVHVTGTMKYDTAVVADRVDGQEELADQMGIRRDRPLWVCGCTGPGEEAVILEAYLKLRDVVPDLQVAIIPRKPERFDEAAAEIEKHRLRFVRRSAARSPDAGQNRSPADKVGVFLGDTMGELRKFYALADVVFVGRTMVPLGGSDVLEVAGLAKPIVVGPSVYNFAEPVEMLRSGGGIVQIDKMVDQPGAVERLTEVTRDLLQDAPARHALGQAARQVLLANQGATARTLALLRGLLADEPARN